MLAGAVAVHVAPRLMGTLPPGVAVIETGGGPVPVMFGEPSWAMTNCGGSVSSTWNPATTVALGFSAVNV